MDGKNGKDDGTGEDEDLWSAAAWSHPEPPNTDDDDDDNDDEDSDGETAEPATPPPTEAEVKEAFVNWFATSDARVRFLLRERAAAAHDKTTIDLALLDASVAGKVAGSQFGHRGGRRGGTSGVRGKRQSLIKWFLMSPAEMKKAEGAAVLIQSILRRNSCQVRNNLLTPINQHK